MSQDKMLDRELKKGSAELLILSLVEYQPRHGYDISKLIENVDGSRAVGLKNRASVVAVFIG
jgi:DNA-binding PadR family transcriptional regulator